MQTRRYYFLLCFFRDFQEPYYEMLENHVSKIPNSFKSGSLHTKAFGMVGLPLLEHCGEEGEHLTPNC